MMRINVLLKFLLGALACRLSTAFVVRSSMLMPLQHPPPIGAAATTTTARYGMLPLQWEDIAYNAQITAGNLANGVLAQSQQQQILTGAEDIATNSNNMLLVPLQAIPILYLAGLLTSVSPCVWGLLPVTVSYITTAAGERADGQTTWPTLSFAAGLALVFCSLGVAAAQLGTVFGASNVVLSVLSASICLAMGLQLLELINVPFLLSLQRNVQSTFQKTQQGDGQNAKPILLDASGRILVDDDKQNSDSVNDSDDSSSLWKTFFLGGSSALVASPCATPVLTSILAYVASEQNVALGALFLLVYTAGYATPLLWISATGGQALADLKKSSQEPGSIYAKVGPWVTPITGGVLLGYGTNGLLTALLGDPSLVALAPVFE